MRSKKCTRAVPIHVRGAAASACSMGAATGMAGPPCYRTLPLPARRCLMRDTRRLADLCLRLNSSVSSLRVDSHRVRASSLEQQVGAARHGPGVSATTLCHMCNGVLGRTLWLPA